MTWSKAASDICKRFNTKVFPLGSKGTPVFKWVHILDGTPEDRQPSDKPHVIDKWAASYKAYGVLAGSEMFILDVDIKEGQNGALSLQYMIQKGLPIDTFTVQTASGGCHLYFNTPKHYTPRLGASLPVVFASEEDREGWDELQKGIASSGIDIRVGNGYVVGPESVTKKGSYKTIVDEGLKDIPLSMQIGRSNTINVSHNTLKVDKTVHFGVPIEPGTRDQELLRFTMDLARKDLPEEFVKVLIERKLEDCVDTDGEAPGWEETWSKYERARDKVDDVVQGFVEDLVYVTSGQRVISLSTRLESKYEDIKRANENKRVSQETVTANGDTRTKKVNPIEVWLSETDRKTAINVVFDPRLGTGLAKATEQDGYIEGMYFNKYMPVNYSENRTPTGKLIFEACLRVIGNVVDHSGDREWFIKWLAMSVIDPSFRPAWGFHIYGTVRGSGKTTLTKIVRALLGESNCKDLNVDSFNKDFNMELFDCSMGFLNDFTRVTKGQSDKVNSGFKRITGTDTYNKQAKYSEAVQSPIFIRFLMTSNNYSDFPVDDGDRRLYKSESKGGKLDSMTMVLAHGIIGMHGSTMGEKRTLGLVISQKDVDSARGYMYEYLKTSDYEDMRQQRDCPHNEIKEIHKDLTKKSHISKIEQAIDHKLFVFQSDIITKMSLQIYLDTIGIMTKVETVLEELEAIGLAEKIPYTTSRGYTCGKQIGLQYMEYDENYDEIICKGGSKNYVGYAIRHKKHWCVQGVKGVARECRVIVGVKQINTVVIKKDDLQ